MKAHHLGEHVGRLARAAPSAFLCDPVFRTAKIGAVLALLFLVGRLSGSPGAVPPAPTPTATLGAAYSQSGGAAAAPAPPTGPIAPSRSLQGLQVTPDAREQPDTFGRLVSDQSRRKNPDASP